MNRNILQSLFIVSALALAACGDKSQPPPESPESMMPAAPAPAPTAAAPADANRPVGQVVDDATVNAKVKSALLADDLVKGTDINVDTRNGEVSLVGAVDSQDQIERAVSVAKSIQGVASVNNQLTLKNKG